MRLMMAATDCNAVSLGVARDTGVKQIKDLKGKRIGMVVGSPALNQNAFAVLAYGGLTQADVLTVVLALTGIGSVVLRKTARARMGWNSAAGMG